MANTRIRFPVTEITVSCNVVFNLSLSVRSDKVGDTNLCLRFELPDIGGGTPIPCGFIDANGAVQSTVCKKVTIAAIDKPQTVAFPFKVSCSRPGVFNGRLIVSATDSGETSGLSKIQIHVLC